MYSSDSAQPSQPPCLESSTFQLVAPHCSGTDPLTLAILKAIRQYTQVLLVLSAVSIGAGFISYSFAPRDYLSEMDIAASDYAAMNSLPGLDGGLDLTDLNGTDSVSPLSLLLSMMRSQNLADRLAKTPAFKPFLDRPLSWDEMDHAHSPEERIHFFLKRNVSSIFDFSRTIYTVRVIDSDPVLAASLLKTVFREADRLVQESYLSYYSANITSLKKNLEETRDNGLKNALARQLEVFERKKIAFSMDSQNGPISTLILSQARVPNTPIAPRLLPSLVIPWLWSLFGFVAWYRLWRRRVP